MKYLYSSFIAILLIGLQACTDLEETPYGAQVADEFYASSTGVNAALADIYAEIRADWDGNGIAGADRGWFDLNETCTDEFMIPTRADGAWDDNGIWRAMYTHTWTASQEFMNNTWNWLYRAVFKGNLAVDLLEGAGASTEQIAEAHVARAYFYYMLMDGWGDIPFYTENNLTVPEIPQTDRAEVYDWVVDELETYVPQLDETVGGKFYGRFNKWAGYALMAKVKIGAEIYSGTADWAGVIAASDAIINSGNFMLTPDLYDNAGNQAVFGSTLDNSEVLLAIFYDANQAKRNIIGIRSLHGPHSSALLGLGAWNGATVHQDFYNKYDGDDKRRDQWFVGAVDGGVTYSTTISSLTSAGLEEGARSAKYLPVAPYDSDDWSSSNDFPIYRYADVLLMKAEALLRNGGSASDAKDLVDEVRNRAGLEDFVGTITLEEIYDERGRELCWEGHRRQDMIRFGTFGAAHDFKPVSSPTYELFPIPATALSNNPTLTQNDGY